MALSRSLLCAVVLVGTTAFSPPALGISTRRPAAPLFAGLGGDKEGGAALAKPKVEIGQKTALTTETKSKVVQKRKAQVADPKSRVEQDFEDAPLFRVILIGDDDYDQTHVIERMCAIIEGMDEGNAASVFKTAMEGGEAMCGKYPKEHAEMYAEQLVRSDPMIFADVRDDKDNNN